MGTVPFSPFDDEWCEPPASALRSDPDLAQAVEQGLRHQLSPFPAEIEARMGDGVLQITLQGAARLDRADTVQRVQVAIADLALPAIETVQVQGYSDEAAAPQWQQVWFEAAGAVKPEIAAHLLLRDRASQGDLVAMATLVQQAVAHKQVQVQAAWEDEQLWFCFSADPLPAAQTCAILACRELTQWSWQNVSVDQIILAGGRYGAPPNWQRPLAIQSAPGLPSIAQVAAGRATEKAARRTVRSTSAGGALPIQSFDREAWRAIAASGVLAGIVLLSPQVSFFLSILITAVHELGHTALAWMFGYPAIPAFDFLHGGGITFYTQQRWPVLVFILYSGLAYLLYRYRHNALTSRYLLGTLAVYSLCLLSPGEDILITAMGHGFEFIFAGIFLYRGLSGFACRHNIERPLYGMLGLFTLAYNLKFAHALWFDAGFRGQYLQGKGGVLDHDLVRLARDYLQWPFNSIVSIFWVLCLLTPALVFLLYRYRYHLLYHLKRCLMP